MALWPVPLRRVCCGQHESVLCIASIRQCGNARRKKLGRECVLIVVVRLERGSEAPAARSFTIGP
jgi:hypothetical protein